MKKGEKKKDGKEDGGVVWETGTRMFFWVDRETRNVDVDLPLREGFRSTWGREEKGRWHGRIDSSGKKILNQILGL